MSAPPVDSDHLLAAAVRQIVADVERRVAPAIVVARAIERLKRLLFDTDELPSERISREGAAALAEMAALGNSRDAAMKVAKRRSRDPHTQQMLAQRFRRLLRKKTSSVRKQAS
jgi:hypothetical protein